MKKTGFYSLFVFSSLLFASPAQIISQGTAIPQTTSAQRTESIQKIRDRDEVSRGFEALRNIGRTAPKTNSDLARTAAIENIRKIYRNPTEKESELLKPKKEDLEKYSQFLRGSDAGLLKLIVDKGCAENTKVFDVSEDCLKYSMPGGGSSYSFRAENYRIDSLADLTYINNSFQSIGIMSHGILVDVGDIPLEQVSLQTKGLKYLTDFQTATDFDEVKKNDRQFLEGVEKDGFVYSRALFAKENTAYVLRSIAYRGSAYRAVDGFVYDEFEFDKRKEMTVAFRIVRRDSESVTIIWKVLDSRKSPKIKQSIEGGE